MSDPRDEFEKVYPIPAFCIRTGSGYASTSYNGWAAHTHIARWEGWKAAKESLVTTCWNCESQILRSRVSECDGYCPECDVEISEDEDDE